MRKTFFNPLSPTAGPPTAGPPTAGLPTAGPPTPGPIPAALYLHVSETPSDPQCNTLVAIEARLSVHHITASTRAEDMLFTFWRWTPFGCATAAATWYQENQSEPGVLEFRANKNIRTPPSKLIKLPLIDNLTAN
jgi:hypothetical protein